MATPAIHQETPPPVEYVLSGNSQYYEELYRTIGHIKGGGEKKLPNSNVYWINEWEINLLRDIELTTQENFKTTRLSVLYQKNLKLLKTAFARESKKYHTYFEVPKERAEEIFDETSIKLSELPFEKATVELTQTNSLKFTLQFKGDKLLLITKTLKPVEDLNESEIIFSFFIKRELILSNVSNISAFVDGFKEFLSN